MKRPTEEECMLLSLPVVNGTSGGVHKLDVEIVVEYELENKKTGETAEKATSTSDLDEINWGI